MTNPHYIFTDYAGERITLSAEVYQVIATKHPEVKRFFEYVRETLADPQIVARV